MKGWMCFLAVLTVAVPGVCAPIAVDVTLTADAFVRSIAPAENHGADGAMCVSGSAAKNGQGVQEGLLDSFIRFNAATFVTTFNADFGTGNWAIQSAVLKLTEQAAPLNPNFNRGSGTFEIRWIANDSWVEGTGTNNLPTTDGICYNDETLVLNPLTDQSLGTTFANTYTNGQESFQLGLASSLVAGLMAGGDVNLFLTATGPRSGSRSTRGTSPAAPTRRLRGLCWRSRPISSSRSLTVSLSLLALGFLGLRWRGRLRRG